MEPTRGVTGAEPVLGPAGGREPAGSTLFTREGVLARSVQRRAGGTALALMLSGSHAAGEAAWAEIDGARLSLSDADLYAVLPSEPDCERARAVPASAAERAEVRAAGLLGGVEVAFLTPSGLSRLPARPGTLTLRRQGRMVFGDAAWLAAVPDHAPSAIDRDERIALLENRGAELLAARAPEAAATGRWRARHAVLKAALDLAGALTLEADEWPASAAARVRRAEGLLCAAEDPAAVAFGAPDPELRRLWQAALRWRSGDAALPTEAECAAEWHAVVRAWCRVWWRATGSGSPGGRGPWSAIRREAARFPWPRRVRRSIAFRPRSGKRPALLDRLRHAGSGTPVHRLMGSVTTLLFAASGPGAAPRLPAEAAAVLDSFGVLRARAWEPAAAEAVGRWEAWVAGFEREDAA